MRKSILTSLTLIIFVVLTGCAKDLVWDHPNASRRQFYQDKMSCRKYATRMAQSAGQSERELARSLPRSSAARASARGAAAGAKQRVKEEAFKECMYSKGWYQREER